MSRRYPTFHFRPLGKLDSIVLFSIVDICSRLSDVSLLINLNMQPWAHARQSGELYAHTKVESQHATA